MATKRMFKIDTCTDDNFLSYSIEARLLYFYINLHADDDGFCTQIRLSISIANGDDDRIGTEHVDELIKGGAIICMNDPVSNKKVYVVTDWKRHNEIKGDRYHPTTYQNIFQQLDIIENRYVIKGRNQDGTHLEPNRNQDGTNLEPENSLIRSNQFNKVNENSIDENNSDKTRLNKNLVIEQISKYGLDVKKMPPDTLNALCNSSDIKGLTDKIIMLKQENYYLKD